MAWFRRPPAPGVMHHSDRGSPVRVPRVPGQAQGIWHGLFDESQRKLLGYAPTESWFNSFKNERYHGLRYATHADMKAASFEYIEIFYNRKRQHSTLGYRSPIQYLEQWTDEQNQEKRAA
jgi:putative transposase